LRQQPIEPAAFSVTVGGRAVPIQIEPLPPEQLTVGIVLDTADGVDPSTFLSQQAGAVGFGLQLDPRPPVGIGPTAGGATSTPHTDRRLALQAIQGLAVGGGRRIVDSLSAVLRTSGSGRRALVVTSAGPDAGGVDAGPLRSALTAAKLRVRWL